MVNKISVVRVFSFNSYKLMVIYYYNILLMSLLLLPFSINDEP